MWFVEYSPVAAFLGTILTAIPVIRAALYLTHRTPEHGKESNHDSRFDQLRVEVNRRLEYFAQHWPPWLTWSLMLGLTLMIYSSGISAIQALSLISM